MHRTLKMAEEEEQDATNTTDTDMVTLEEKCVEDDLIDADSDTISHDNQVTLMDLPLEIRIMIVSYLPIKDYLELRRSSGVPAPLYEAFHEQNLVSLHNQLLRYQSHGQKDAIRPLLPARHNTTDQGQRIQDLLERERTVDMHFNARCDYFTLHTAPVACPLLKGRYLAYYTRAEDTFDFYQLQLIDLKDGNWKACRIEIEPEYTWLVLSDNIVGCVDYSDDVWLRIWTHDGQSSKPTRIALSNTFVFAADAYEFDVAILMSRGQPAFVRLASNEFDVEVPDTPDCGLRYEKEKIWIFVWGHQSLRIHCYTLDGVMILHTVVDTKSTPHYSIGLIVEPTGESWYLRHRNLCEGWLLEDLQLLECGPVWKGMHFKHGQHPILVNDSVLIHIVNKMQEAEIRITPFDRELVQMPLIHDLPLRTGEIGRQRLLKYVEEGT